MPKIEKENFRPDRTRLALVQKCAEEIEPDNAEAKTWLQNYARVHSDRIAFDLEIVERYSAKGDAIVEFGSLPLLLTAPLKSLGYDVQGIDLDPNRMAAAISKLDLRVLKCDVETERLPLETGSCDIAIFNELFEHLRINPIFTVEEVHRVLKPGGLMLMSTPNLRSLKGLTNFLFRNKAYSCLGSVYDEYRKLEVLGHMGHVREYTTREVSEFLSRCGFKLQTLIFRGRYDQIVAQQVARLIPSSRPFVTYVARADK
jgi:SAM-dependent methyltransferase